MTNICYSSVCPSYIPLPSQKKKEKKKKKSTVWQTKEINQHIKIKYVKIKKSKLQAMLTWAGAYPSCEHTQPYRWAAPAHAPVLIPELIHYFFPTEVFYTASVTSKRADRNHNYFNKTTLKWQSAGSANSQTPS